MTGTQVDPAVAAQVGPEPGAEAVRRAEQAGATDVQEFGSFWLSRFLGLDIS